MSWAPVKKMLRSGAATERDVTAAIGKAKKASFHHQHRPEGVEGSQDSGADAGSMVDFVGFLEFIHSLDIEVCPIYILVTEQRPFFEVSVGGPHRLLLG